MSSKVNPSVEPPTYADATSSGYNGASHDHTQHTVTNHVEPPATYIEPDGSYYRNTVPGSEANNTISSYRTATLNTTEHFPTHSIQTTCYDCQQTVTTKTSKGLGSMGKCMCCVLSLWGMCWIVLCCDGYKDTIHRCPHCKKELGRYEVGKQNTVHNVTIQRT